MYYITDISILGGKICLIMFSFPLEDTGVHLFVVGKGPFKTKYQLNWLRTVPVCFLNRVAIRRMLSMESCLGRPYHNDGGFMIHRNLEV